MKTLEEFIKEIETSKELQEKFRSLKGKDATDAFLKNHDCDAVAHELAEFNLSGHS